MKKNSGEEIRLIEVDPITGNYFITLPEWIINELSWYEETQVKISLDGKDIILNEHSDND